jgi:hypothetical protein
VVGPAFSAATKDPVHRRFASIDDYFRRAPDTVKKAFWVRVYVRDDLGGRQAVLWGTSSHDEISIPNGSGGHGDPALSEAFR